MGPSTTSLFVYGTLRRGSSVAMAERLRRESIFVGEAEVAGRLFDIGSYPGMVVTANGSRVRGEIYRVEADRWPEFVKVLDDYENCGEDDPQPAEYHRQVVEAQLDGGEQMLVWAYLFNRPTAGFREISSGEWQK